MGLKVTLDTSVFIYFLEKHPQFFEASEFILNKIIQQEWHGFASVLALGELLVMPFRLGHTQAIADYTRFLMQFPYLVLLDINQEIITEAAQIRANHPSLKTPDAIHLATANLVQSDYLITNDARLTKNQAINVILIKDAKGLV